MAKKKLQLVLVGLVVSVFVMSGVLAGYLLIYERSITGQILSSGEDLIIVEELSDFNFTSDSYDQFYSDELIISRNNIMLMDFTIDHQLINLDVDCDPTGDLLIEFRNSTNDVIETGSVIALYDMDNVFNYSVFARASSCPQNLTTTILMTEA